MGLEAVEPLLQCNRSGRVGRPRWRQPWSAGILYGPTQSPEKLHIPARSGYMRAARPSRCPIYCQTLRALPCRPAGCPAVQSATLATAWTATLRH